MPPIQGDSVELQQVLLNLITNSIDAMEAVDAASRLLQVSTAEAPNGMVKVSVRDSGMGRAGLDLERIFGLFFTTKPKGTRVGLAISRSIVAAHGGRL